ncbi:dihydrofolate reductase [Naumannella cuiyingiana]|uniref:Dihydrofolate reductase n=1 Tax=Naumannella cuiyingiana TaxID=1347891 RepID=A0A7Z0IMF2_9ACTN|nr:dihydrofolate reductase family protein [Naumannella cuiyingiana]NYI72558.1 dihydrofolate reductase [Naumannella cuiyingiana]
MRKLVYYIATSIDGYIADSTGDTSAFPVCQETLDDLFSRYPETCPQHLRGPLGVTGSARRFDTVILGRSTHEPALQAGLTSAYPHLRQLVVTHHALPEDPTVEALSGDLGTQVSRLKRDAGDDIWLCGGSDVAGQLLDEIDEIQLKVNPITLGSGMPLFRSTVRRTWHVSSAEPLAGGIVLVTYTPADQ